MSTWQHASLVRLQPHYVYILGSSKGAVTTALHAHSTRKRLIGVNKDRFTPTPCHPALPMCSASLKGRGYNRVSATFCAYVAQCGCISFWDLALSLVGLA